MTKKNIVAFTAIVVISMMALMVIPGSIVNAAYGPGNEDPKGNGRNRTDDTNNSNGNGGGDRYTPLTTDEIKGLQEAILEEYGALNLYNKVIEQNGEVIPFVEIARSEQQHLNALVRQADKYGIEVPANPGLSSQPSFATLAEACQAGAETEKADAALFDEIKQVTSHSDLLRVYNNLQSASLNNHLPAFELCE